MMLSSVISEGMATNISVTMHSVQTPMMLDSCAEVSVLHFNVVRLFNAPIPLPTRRRDGRTFGNHHVELLGPVSLELLLCGMTMVHSFYLIDVPTPVIGGYDLMRAARLVADVSNRLVWSRRPESTVPDTVSPNPEAAIRNSSVYSGDHMVDSVPTSRVTEQFGPSRSSELPFTEIQYSQQSVRQHSTVEPTATVPGSGAPGDQGPFVSFSTVEVPEHLHELYDQTVEQSQLSSRTQCYLVEVLRRNSAAFATHSLDLGHCSVLQHDIDTRDAKPTKQPPRRPAISARRSEDIIHDEMLEIGVAEPSCFLWLSPVCTVEKKYGTFRFCIDYRRLNDVTEKDAFSVPDVKDALDSLEGAKCFATIDLLSGYWQLGLTERARERSAFCTRRCLFEFTRMPFDLTNASSTLCRPMHIILQDLLYKMCICYFDDIIVFAETPEQLTEHLDVVFSRLRQHGLKAKPSKCVLFKSPIELLGHLVSADGIEPQTEKLEA